MSTKLVNLPIATIQHDFQTVISEVHSGIIPFDSFWVSCYKTSVPSVHAKILVELDERDRDLVKLTPKDGDVDVKRNGVSRVPLDVEGTHHRIVISTRLNRMSIL